MRATPTDKGQPDLVTHPLAHGSGNLCRCSEEVDGAGDVKEGLVDGYPLDPRGEVVEHGHHLVAEFLVAAEMAADEEELPAELASPPTGHAGPDAIAPGLVGGRQHDATTDSDRPALQ